MLHLSGEWFLRATRGQKHTDFTEVEDPHKPRKWKGSLKCDESSFSDVMFALNCKPTRIKFSFFTWPENIYKVSVSPSHGSVWDSVWVRTLDFHPTVYTANSQLDLFLVIYSADYTHWAVATSVQAQKLYSVQRRRPRDPQQRLSGSNLCKNTSWQQEYVCQPRLGADRVGGWGWRGYVWEGGEGGIWLKRVNWSVTAGAEELEQRQRKPGLIDSVQRLFKRQEFQIQPANHLPDTANKCQRLTSQKVLLLKVTAIRAVKIPHRC